MVELDNDYARACHFDQNTNNTYCACDFRINIHRCDHNEFFVKASWIALVLNLVNTTLSAMFLFYLIKIKGQPFFLNPTRERGIIRPKPIHSFQLYVLVYNSTMAFNTICLITESYPHIMWAELGYFLPLAVCGSLAIFSPLSLVYSTPSIESRFEDSGRAMIPNKNFLDIIGFIFIIHPFILFIPSVVLSGYYSDINDIEKATLFFKIHYLSWTISAIFYLTLLSYLYYRLISVINIQINNFKKHGNDSDINTWRRAKRNINGPLLHVIGGVMFQIILSLTFAISYKELTIYIDGINILYYFCWNILIPFTGLISEIMFLCNIFFSNEKPKWWLTLKSNSQQSQTKQYESETNTNIDDDIKY